MWGYGRLIKYFARAGIKVFGVKNTSSMFYEGFTERNPQKQSKKHYKDLYQGFGKLKTNDKQQMRRVFSR